MYGFISHDYCIKSILYLTNSINLSTMQVFMFISYRSIIFFNCLIILDYFQRARIYSLSAIKPQDVYHVFSKNSHKVTLGGTLRSFLQYLFKTGILMA